MEVRKTSKCWSEKVRTELKDQKACLLACFILAGFVGGIEGSSTSNLSIMYSFSASKVTDRTKTKMKNGL